MRLSCCALGAPNLSGGAEAERPLQGDRARHGADCQREQKGIPPVGGLCPTL
jgi:hypothetical protein